MKTNNVIDLEIIITKAKSMTTLAAQKRCINKLFREATTRDGLPDFNNDFNPADRAITRLNKHMSDTGIDFEPRTYATHIGYHIKQVKMDAWTKA